MGPAGTEIPRLGSRRPTIVIIQLRVNSTDSNAASPRSDNRVRRGNPGEVLVATFIAAVLLTALGWLLAGTLLKHVDVSPAELDAVRRAMATPRGNQVGPEPVERWLFILLSLAAPLCALAGLALAKTLGRCRCCNLKPAMQSVAALAAGMALFDTIFVKTSLGYRLFPFQTKGSLFPVLPGTLENLVSVVASVAVLFAAVSFRGSQDSGGWLRLTPLSRSRRRVWGGCVALLLAALVFLPRGISIYSALDKGTGGTYALQLHFQACAFGLTQLCAGKALALVTPLYGGYAQMLLPLFRLTGLSVFKFALVMTTLFAVSGVSVVAVMVRFIRQPVVFVLGAMAILYYYALCYNWSPDPRAFDPYFQYWPVRVLFPAISIPLYLWVARRAEHALWLAMGVFCGAALCWNLESGIAVTGATLFAFIGETISRAVRRSDGVGGIRCRLTNVVMVVAGLTAVYFGFSFYLQWAARGVRPLHTTAEYQRLFYEFGYLMIPMPNGLHPWMAVMTTYLLALTLGMRSFFDGRHSPLARLSVFLSILGTGLFTYYQGRSHDTNFAAVAWPSIVLGYIFSDRLLRAIRAGVFAPGLRWLALPAVYLGCIAVLLLPRKAAVQAWRGIPRWRAALTSVPTHPSDSLCEQIDFIRAHMGSDRMCAIFTCHQAVHYAETGLRFQYNLPGVSELFFASDEKAVQTALDADPARHLFVDRPTASVLELWPVIARRYRVVAICPTGDIAYLEPK